MNLNCYASLPNLKSRLGIPTATTTYDSDLTMLLNAASRLIDKHCDRFFYALTATKYYDGNLTLTPKEDILSITTLKTDEDGDATYENSYATTDYYLYPLNSFPKIRIVINPNGDYGSFNAGILNGVQIVGVFGYGNGESSTPYSDSTTTTNEALDATETGVDVVSGTPLSAGQTILVESEQMFITSISTNTLTVKRGVNGTTAATHDTAKTVYIYEYPDQVTEATIIQALRWWKRKDSAYQDVVGLPELGTVAIYKGLDPDVKQILLPYVKLRY